MSAATPSAQQENEQKNKEETFHVFKVRRLVAVISLVPPVGDATPPYNAPGAGVTYLFFVT
jgi:hypothetical protein